MSRRSHRSLAALFALAASVLFPGAVLGNAKKPPRAKQTVSSKADDKAQVTPSKDRPAAPTTTPQSDRSPSSKAASAAPAKSTKAAPAKSKETADPVRTDKKRAASAQSAEKPKPSPAAKPKAQSEPSFPAKRGPAGKAAHTPASRPIAAKSLPKEGDGERSQVSERALKPPGAARPMLRQVPSRLVTPPREIAERTLAFRYANLGDTEAVAELNRRGIAWVPASPPLPGVRTPIRLSGPLRGVTIHSTLPERERRSSAFEILDARLALALDDFCALLARHDVVELVHYTMYRPPAELPTDWNKLIRHPAGLAIDVGAVRKADGRWLAIGPHWPSDIGAKTCGEGAREHWSRPGREIVSIACEAADLGMFHFILTPHFDAAHADHLHLEIKPDTRWFLVN
jgi:hypothetical protein